MVVFWQLDSKRKEIKVSFRLYFSVVLGGSSFSRVPARRGKIVGYAFDRLGHGKPGVSLWVCD